MINKNTVIIRIKNQIKILKRRNKFHSVPTICYQNVKKVQ